MTRPVEPTSSPILPVRAAFLPAVLLARLRPELLTSLRQDAIRFSGPRTIGFLLLAVLAAGYPIAASIAHAIGDPDPLRADALALALRPGFDIVYAESLPFMLAAVGIGLFSPALGTLLVAVFVPADLLAASASPLELENYGFQPLEFGAVLARLASYGLLWILAVEIPLAVRQVATNVGMARESSSGSMARSIAASALAAGVLVYMWAAALPLLISPVFTWSGIQTVRAIATDPTWDYWPILVGGSVILAAAAARFPAPLREASGLGARPRPPSKMRVLIGHACAALVLSLLLGGLIDGPLTAVALIGGLLLVGPGLTIILPRLSLPAALTAASPSRRAVMSAIATLALASAAVFLLGNAMFRTDYLPLTLITIGSIGVFRLLAEGGASPMSAPSTPSALSEVNAA